MTKINIAIIGTSGYTAIELIRLTHNHPNINIKYLIGRNNAGKKLEEIYPHTIFKKSPKIENIENVNFHNIDVIFLCLPHGESSKIVPKLPDTKIIDLSADYRIKKTDIYKNYYKQNLPTLINQSCYGLSEINKKEILKSRIIACPGCYPTSILLPLIPLIQSKAIDKEDNIIIDSKTGISGAGRKINQQSLFCEINENVIPYNISGHRHLAEITEQLGITDNIIQFTPQIIPISRGIISTIYIKSLLKKEEIEKILTNKYKNNFFIKITKTIPQLRNVIGTNYCQISVQQLNIKNQFLIISIIDNLTKGSSGQAIQNLNLMYNLPENTGLDNIALYP